MAEFYCSNSRISSRVCRIDGRAIFEKESNCLHTIGTGGGKMRKQQYHNRLLPHQS